MQINGIETNRGGKVYIHRQNGGVRTNVFGEWEIITNPGRELDLCLEIARLDKIKSDYTTFLNELLTLRPLSVKKVNMGVSVPQQVAPTQQAQVAPVQVAPVEVAPTTPTQVAKKVVKKPKQTYPKIDYTPEDIEFMESTTQQYMDFCKDLEFEPSIRNVNTFAYKCKDGLNDAKDYFVQRLRLCCGEYEMAMSKVKSDEFETIVNKFAQFKLNGKKINSRLVIYEGIPGGGKTTKAMKESKGNCIICNSSMLPSDLIEDFKLKDGKGNLIPSPLRQAMENGEKILLDEINTLTLDCCRFLQGLTDNKETFKYKDEEIIINEGFQIIGTMNLFINGTPYPITPQLCDRCEDIVEFKLTNKKIVKLAFND